MEQLEFKLKKSLCPNTFYFYKFFKVLVIIVTLVCVGFGIYGVLNIKLDYDAIWFMDQKSYQTQYFKRFEEAFPDQGERVEVYIGEFKICLPNLC